MIPGRVVRAGLAVLVALTAVAAAGSPVAAHALVQSSDPAPGAVLQRAPAAVTLTLNERADVALSSIHVLDTSGVDHAEGPLNEPPSSTAQVRVGLGPIGKGVYTVQWRTVSVVDGHTAGGSFAFGIQVVPLVAASVQPPETSSLSVLGAAARGLYYGALCAALGGLLIGTMLEAPPAVNDRLHRALLIALTAALVGALLVTEAQREAAGAGVGALFSTSLGVAALFRGAPLLVALAVTVVRRRRHHLGIVLVALSALGDVLSGHAATQAPAVVNVTLQAVHVIAAGLWVGGLAALLLVLPGSEPIARGAMVRRFSRVATICLAAVALTGIVRAYLEIGNWGALTGTVYGWIVIAKTALLIGLAALGARNHFRHAPRAQKSVDGLRRTGSAEMGLATVALLLAAMLVNVAPPASVAAAPAVQEIVVSASDAATSVRVTLTAAPGFTGFNGYRVSVTDYDSGAPIDDASVTLTFHPTSGGGGDSSITLTHASAGAYAGAGGQLGLPGEWQVTVLVARPHTATTVLLRLTPSSHPVRVTCQRGGPGVPNLYTITRGDGGTVQVYLDPDAPGAAEFHTTFLDAAGQPQAINGVTVVATPPHGPILSLSSRFLDTGHFVSDVVATTGATHYAITATTAAGNVSVATDLTPGATTC